MTTEEQALDQRMELRDDDQADYLALIASYLPAAEVCEFSRNDIEVAINKACRFSSSCVSCRHSRAPHNALDIAENDGRLNIYERSCSLRHLPMNGCPHWQRLEVPAMAEVVA